MKTADFYFSENRKEKEKPSCLERKHEKSMVSLRLQGWPHYLEYLFKMSRGSYIVNYASSIESSLHLLILVLCCSYSKAIQIFFCSTFLHFLPLPYYPYSFKSSRNDCSQHVSTG